jgi:signal peptidase I
VSASLQLIILLGAGQLSLLSFMHLRRRWRARLSVPVSLRLARVAATSLLLGTGLGVFGVIVAPSLVGGRALTVMSGSMEPALGVGDVVIDSRVSPAEVRVGDIVTFSDPEGTGKLITHRVRRVRIDGGTAHLVTKGDNGNAVERWDVPAGGSLGRVEYRVPLLGFFVFWLNGPFARIGLIVIPALLLAGFELWRIWRPQRPRRLGDATA